MCHSEIKKTTCNLCYSVITTEEAIERKCSEVIKSNAKFGGCRKIYGPYETLVRAGACSTC